MDVFWKIELHKTDFVLKSFFQLEGESYELSLEQNKLCISRNGKPAFDINDSESFKQQLSDKSSFLLNSGCSFVTPFASKDVKPIIIFQDKEVIGLSFQGKGFYVSFDDTFQRFMKCTSFIESVSLLKQLVDKGGERKVLVNDVVIFEEYLHMDSNCCRYYGFLDNENAEEPQEIFNFQLADFKELLGIITSLNTLLCKKS